MTKAEANKQMFEKGTVVNKDVAPKVKAAPVANVPVAPEKIQEIREAGVRVVGTFKILEGTLPMPTGNDIGASAVVDGANEIKLDLKVGVKK